LRADRVTGPRLHGCEPRHYVIKDEIFSKKKKKIIFSFYIS